MLSRVQGICSRGYRVHALEGTGNMLSRVQGTWFRGYRVHGFEGTWFRGYRVYGFELGVQAQDKMEWPLQLGPMSNRDARCKTFSDCEVKRKYPEDSR